MERTNVCAILAPGERLDAAVREQSRQPESAIAEGGSLRGLVERALDSGAGWIWVLDGSAAPRPGALAELLDALERVDGLVEPHLMTGAVLGPDGQVDEGRVLWYRRNQIDIAMEASSKRVLPVRAATGSVLVSAEAARAEPPRRGGPPSPANVVEWTAHVLRERTGYLVPESESEALEPGYDPAGRPRTAARLLFGDALVRFDRLRYGFELAERLAGRSMER